jgi:hypothetical protein
MELHGILELNLKDDKFRSGTIHNWIDGEKGNDPISGNARKQLQSYIWDHTVQRRLPTKISVPLQWLLLDRAGYSCVRWIGVATGSASFSLRNKYSSK